MHNAGTGDGADGLVFIREIGGQCFGCAMRRPRIAANYAESLIPCGEKFDEFVRNGTACSKFRLDYCCTAAYDSAGLQSTGAACR